MGTIRGEGISVFQITLLVDSSLLNILGERSTRHDVNGGGFVIRRRAV